MTKLSVDDSEIGKKTDEQPRFADQLNYDAILTHIGQVGKYSLLTFVPLCLAAFMSPVVMIYNFVGGIPKYRCLVNGCDNETDPVYDQPWLNATIPFDDKGKLDRCHRYDVNWTDVDQCLVGSSVFQNVTCDQWVFDTSVFEDTVVTEFNLTCEDQGLQTLANSLYMFGWLVGAVTGGNLADFFGRRIMFTLLSLYQGAVVLGTAFAADYVTFAVLRFMAGFGESGFYIALYIWGLEAIGPKYRVTFGFVFAVMRSLGIVALGVLGYFIRIWWMLQIIWSVPILLLISYFWLIPESTRWLISKQRFDQAQKQILKAAKVNGKTVPSHLLLAPRDVNENNAVPASTDVLTAPVKGSESRRSSSTSSGGQQTADEAARETLIDVFKSTVLLRRIIIMVFTWIATIMGYYGITFAASNLSGNFYLNFELSALVEVPALLLGMFTMNYFGRRPTTSACLIAGGIASLITGFVPEDPEGLRIGFSLFGKFCISCAVSSVYSYTAEMFPTTSRSAAVGLCSTSGRIGGILAPYISALGETNAALPYIIFGGVDLIMGCLVLMLPETKGTSLPSNVREAEQFEKYNLPCFRCGVDKSDDD